MVGRSIPGALQAWSAALRSPNIWGPHPKMVWGHNLQHMAPIGATTIGFCMVFQYATLIFLTLDPIFGADNPGSGSWKAWAPFLGPKQRQEKVGAHEVSLLF